MQAYEYEEIFHEETLDGYSAAAQAQQPMEFPQARNRVNFELTQAHVGKRVVMSERYSGAGLKKCILVCNGIRKSVRRLGAGTAFMVRVTDSMVGSCYFDYNGLNGTGFKSALEISAR